MKKIIGIIVIALLFTGCSDSKELKLVVNKTNGIDITCASKSQNEVVCLILSFFNNFNTFIKESISFGYTKTLALPPTL